MCMFVRFGYRWEAVFRGTPRVLCADEINQDQMRRFNLVLWGTPSSNMHIKTGAMPIVEAFHNDRMMTILLPIGMMPTMMLLTSAVPSTSPPIMVPLPTIAELIRN